MKTKLLIIISCLVMLAGCCCKQSTEEWIQGYTISSSYINIPSYNCQCADPQCISCNPCLARSRCCRDYGNIGARCRCNTCDPLTVDETLCDCISYQAPNCWSNEPHSCSL